MHRNRIIIATGLLSCAVAAAFAVSGCSHPEKKEDQQARWINKMQQLSESISVVMPYAASPRAFQDPQNFPLLKSEMRTIAQLAREVEHDKTGAPSADPVISFSSKKFAQDMEATYRELANGNLTFARLMVLNSTNYCISCHSRSAQGQHHFVLGWDADLGKFSPTERAQYLFATRQYDRALGEFEKITADGQVMRRDPRAWERAVTQSLAIAVRVKKSPDLALKLVTNLIETPDVPVYLKLTALSWREAVQAWKKNETVPKDRAQAVGQAKALLARATKEVYPQASAGLIYSLRASGILHDLLSQKSADAWYGEALYLAGVAAENLRDVNLGSLDEAYFEACIRERPDTPVARGCFVRLESLLVSDLYGGSDGYLPDHVRAKLDELRKLANDRGNRADWEALRTQQRNERLLPGR